MSTTVKAGWLKDKEGNKFAPKTLISQVQTNDGVLLEDKIQADLNDTKEDILANFTITADSALSPTSTNPVQNKVLDAEFEAIHVTTNELAQNINKKADKVHSHDDLYYTEAEIDGLLSTKANSEHNHDSDYDEKGAANTALNTAKSYADSKVSGLASTSAVNTSIGNHNTSSVAHNDIRALISDLSTAVNKFLDVDDTTKDQLSEVLTLINNNKDVLESLTTTKINVSDIVNNLTTNNSSKVLSAAQGVVIQGLIDTLQEEVDSHTHEIANIQTTLNAKVPTSRTVNGKALSSNISLSASDVGAYAKTEIDDMVFIAVEDIDAICGASIQSINEVMF